MTHKHDSAFIKPMWNTNGKKKKERWESADLSVSPISDLYSHLITLNFPKERADQMEAHSIFLIHSISEMNFIYNQ